MESILDDVGPRNFRMKAEENKLNIRVLIDHEIEDAKKSLKSQKNSDLSKNQFSYF